MSTQYDSDDSQGGTYQDTSVCLSIFRESCPIGDDPVNN